MCCFDEISGKRQIRVLTPFGGLFSQCIGNQNGCSWFCLCILALNERAVGYCVIAYCARAGIVYGYYVLALRLIAENKDMGVMACNGFGVCWW